MTGHEDIEAPSSAANAGGDRWNHNIHYGRQLLGLIPDGAQDALDVGCGEGWLVREMRQRVGHVVGIDTDAFSILAARAVGDVDGVEYLQGDLLTWPFQPASFDFVTAVASLHHLDEEAALTRMAQLLRPGGTLGVAGLARTRSPRDLAFDIAGAVATWAHKRTKIYWETPAPKIWPPPHHYGELRHLSATVLPGRRFRRGAMWRYVLTWTKPTI
ncbi:MAG: class I SAM-dependent methyltransferase [Acidimicrobiales bacterium]